MSVITKIGTAVPKYKVALMDLYNYLRDVHADNAIEDRTLRFMYSTSGITNKYVCLPDLHEPNAMSVMKKNAPELGVEERQAIYNKESVPLAKEAILNCMSAEELKTVTHLITVSCTGLSAPGLDIQLLLELGMNKNVQRTSINFMGCYAAVHGLKQAHQIVHSNPNAKVLFVCVELCSIHFQKMKTEDNITSTIVFADGAAAVLVENNSSKKGLHINDFYSEVRAEGYDDMGWQITKSGYTMTLTGKVPVHLTNSCNEIIVNAMQQYGLNTLPNMCVHPGGRKILEAVEKAMLISKADLASSYEVLKEYGNMSSPTILFVLNNMWQKFAAKENTEEIIGMAFGPGLTLETFHATYHA
jgi:predicted naringenin-chalcone synthase